MEKRLLEILHRSIDKDEVSSLVDVTQDILNFKGNLVQTDKFRLANKPDRIVVEFRKLKAPKNVFYLEFGKHDPYNVVAGRVAQKLAVNKIRLTRHNCSINRPYHDYIETVFDGCLLDVLILTDKICNVLYYEVLDDPQVDWAHKKLNVSYGYPYQKASVVLSRRSRVKDLLNDIKPKMKLTNSSAELRLLGIHDHKIYKFFHVEEKIEDIPDEANLWVDEVLEEKNHVPGHHLIRVYHFAEMVNGAIVKFGEPFLLVFCEDDTLAKVKVRINEKLRINDEEFSKWKFTLLCVGRLRYLKDSDVLYNCFEGKNVAQYLGLEHSETDESDNWTFEVDSSDWMQKCGLESDG